MIRAAVDVGSNSVLLLIAERKANSWKTLLETTKVTALGEKTRTTGRLGESGMESTLSALREAFRVAREHGAQEVLAAVTMAGRLATNTADFLKRAQEQGTPVFVLSGEEEADLGFQAVAEDPVFAGIPRISIVDVGGHSTELVTAERVGQSWKVLYRKSFPVGTLGLRETILQAESPDGAAILQASTAIDSVVGLTYLPGQAGEVVALGATGTNLVCIRDRLTKWDPERVHGATLDYEEVSRAAGWMFRMTDAERAEIPGMEKGREKTLHIGALILERFLNAVKAPECRVSIKGWRHALLDHPELFVRN